VSQSTTRTCARILPPGWRHNIEEVGMFEHILPPLYRRETGLDQ
jgi:hypothetical protein